MAMAIPICSLMALRSVKRKSLTRPAALVGWATGMLMVGAGPRGLTLFFFYLLGSAATKHRAREKRKLVGDNDDDNDDDDDKTRLQLQRGVVQVMCTSSLACGLTVYTAVRFGREEPLRLASPSLNWAAAIVAHHATALADTLASELGVLYARRPPVSILNPTTTVPIGTNGGITMTGCAISLVGGALVGCFTVMVDLCSGNAAVQNAPSIILFGALTGLVGSLLDSLIGALFQVTYVDAVTGKVVDRHKTGARHYQGLDILTNEQVNLVSTAITMYLGGWIVASLLFA
jgi:uncharacterized protein (TIGR00297 family)